MSYSINVKSRTEKAEGVRRQGLIPGIIYGADNKPASIAVNYLVFEKLYKEAGESNLVDLTVEDGKGPTKVLIQEVQRDPVKDTFIHVDFMKINMNKEMYATIPLHFVGESAAVKTLGGTLVEALDELEIKCLPKDLISFLEVDISKLENFDDVIHVKDLLVPENIQVQNNPDTVIVKVAAPLTEEQLKAMEESGPADISAVEVEGAKKEEDGAEGVEDKGKEEEEKKAE